MFIGASAIGYAGLVWILLAPALAAWTRQPLLRTTLVTAGTVWFADLTAIALKSVFERPRPFERLGEVDALLGATVGASMPSGHAATSFAGAVVLAGLVRRATPALFALAVLIAVSRVYVGVHYPLDILAGAVLGAAVALGVLWLVRAPRTRSGVPPRSAGSRPPG